MYYTRTGDTCTHGPCIIPCATLFSLNWGIFNQYWQEQWGVHASFVWSTWTVHTQAKESKCNRCFWVQGKGLTPMWLSCLRSCTFFCTTIGWLYVPATTTRHYFLSSCTVSPLGKTNSIHHPYARVCVHWRSCHHNVACVRCRLGISLYTSSFCTEFGDAECRVYNT